MASSANSNTVPKLYRSVMEDVINEVRELFLDEGVDEQVLMELKTLWESKLMQSKAVDGFHTEEQQALQAQQQQAQQAQMTQAQSQPQQVLLPPVQQAPQQQVIVQDPKLLQHMSATGMSAAATAATLALPTGVTPFQQIITQQGQILQVVRAANGAQYIIQPQQQMVLQPQVLPQMQPGGVQAPVIQQVLTPLQGGLSQQTGVIIQPQQIVLTGNKVQQNTQVMQAAAMAVQQAQGAAQIQAQPQAQPPQQQQQQQTQQQQPSQQQPPMMLQVDGAGDTSSEEDEEEEDEYDEDEDEDKEKDGGEDGQVEEEPLNSGDDVSDEEDQELFDTENVVVCQYDKIHRSKNKWKFHLKDGIMNLNGRDYVFSKAIGDAEW
ncbi:transcription initiation factor IIA subunit 1 isoform X1 [Pimephales promelas]|uniref:transcription initiation factor IIA subunit 1 isoform X1 n=2 Tax=Pimephales promelas TaxID=90988 RepID=UPI001955913C|nr:transcription initiation factor IIA subunit 1 isoform X1 [Pimephales promelas]KAG1964688.1 transcription initiation factor IIA subunit [Pimephales promelas]